MSMSPRTILVLHLSAVLSFASFAPGVRAAFIPGTVGHLVVEASDNFDDPGWTYDFVAGESSTGYIDLDGVYRPLFIRDSGRGDPDRVERVVSPVAGGDGALLIAATDNVYSQSGLVWQTNHAVVPGPSPRLTPAMMPSATMHVHVPHPDTWPQPPVYDDFFAAFCTAYTYDDQTYWPGFRASTWTADGSPAWTFDTDQYGWVDIPITEAGWWTLGSSLDEDGLHYFLRQGIGTLTMDDYQGSFEMGNVREVTGMFGHNLVVQHFGQFVPNAAPLWGIDEMKFYIVPEPSAMVILAAAAGTFALRRRRRRN